VIAPMMTAPTMAKFANQKPLRAAAAAACVAIGLALTVAASEVAFGDNAGQAAAPPVAQAAPSPAAPSAAPAGSPPAAQESAPGYRPGFFHQLRIWWDESLAMFDRKEPAPPPSPADAANKSPGDTAPGVTDKAKEAAASAITTSQDAMKNAVEATKGAASTAGDAMKGAVEATKGAASTASDAMKGAVEATKDAATAIVRLPNIRVMQVSEVCARAPNGGSDCGTAATNVCRAKGFNGGAPLDVRTGSHCDPKPPPQAGQTPTVHCASESVVTRVVCQ
jgi:colicin import membrane protein